MARGEEVAQGVRGWWVPSLDPQKEREEQKMASFGLTGERDCELWALWGVNQVEPGSLGKTDGSGGHVCLWDTVPGTQGDGQARGQQDREVLFSCCGALISKTKAWDPGSEEGCGWGHRIRDENPPPTPSSADVPVGYRAYQTGSIGPLHTGSVAAMVSSARQQNVLKGPPHWKPLLENSNAEPCGGGRCLKRPILALECRARRRRQSLCSWAAIVTGLDGEQQKEGPAGAEWTPPPPPLSHCREPGRWMARPCGRSLCSGLLKPVLLLHDAQS